MTAVFSFQYKKAYKVSSQWNTIIDDLYSGGEQRRNQWTNSRRKWVLEFDKNITDSNAIMAFFDARKGKFESFLWTWQSTHPDTGENMGGDGLQHKVRFNDDTLDFSHIKQGYNSFEITLIEVAN